ncbi:MAG: tetratricopeptide repeat protein, partial [Candidatus Omnitrophica bacterium]|nr:tetratricopeptide repeat protein [Candidatus Omnitrophota bacterium]
ASVTGLVDKGNRLYKDQKFEDALKLYDQALSAQPNSAVINFNEGAAQYKTKEYQQANSSFEKALTTDDKGLEAKANYNLGNSRYMWGVSKENSDLQGAVQLLEGALSNYKRALELTQKDEDAKVNYKIAEEKLKELKEKLKKQPQQNQNNQQQQEQPKPQDQQEQNK